MKIELKTKEKIVIEILNPDTSSTHFSGEPLTINNQTYLYRGYKVWVNLAELLQCRLLTPLCVSEERVRLSFKKLNQSASFHTAVVTQREEKYGVDSEFFAINKNEEPTFLLTYQKALESVQIANRKSILNLGINKGDEFELIGEMVGRETFENMRLVGIDHSQSALTFAQSRFSHAHFYPQDINRLASLKLEKSDLIISIGTLQSPSINYKPFLMSLVQQHLTKDGALILGFPNSRWIDHELLYGAIPPNYPYSEMSLVFGDVIFAKKYLQQKKFRVTITGREYIFLTATKFQTK
jgi:hypothetical protein